MPTEITLIEQALHAYSNQYLGDAGGVEYRIGQTFTLSVPAILTAVSIYFDARSNTPTGNVTYRIETLSSSLPSGTLANANLTKAFSPTDNDWNKQTFATPAQLAAGSYALVADCDNQSDSYCWVAGMHDDVYAGGNVVRKTSGSWGALTGYDHPFRIYGYPAGGAGRIIMVL